MNQNTLYPDAQPERFDQNEELARNAKYRQEAVQPMVEKLFEISLKLDTVNMLLMTQNDLLAELIRRTR